jgi:hypothetical protein
MPLRPPPIRVPSQTRTPIRAPTYDPTKPTVCHPTTISNPIPRTPGRPLNDEEKSRIVYDDEERKQ